MDAVETAGGVGKTGRLWIRRRPMRLTNNSPAN